MKMFSSFCVLLLCGQCAQAFKFLSDDHRGELAPAKGAGAEAPAEGGEAPAEGGEAPVKGAEGEAPAEGGEPLEGPAHKDNFQDELVDQADPEFKMVSGGDDCISWDDAKAPLDQQISENAPYRESMSEAEKEEEDMIMKDMLKDLKLMYKHVDQNGDGCIDRTEFKQAGEMEGPPPGFEEEQIGKSEKDPAEAEAEFKRQMQEQERFEFQAMDRSGDNKVSKQEAYHYASKNMPHADVTQEDMDKMFNQADKDGDGFITFDEFSAAGEEIDGDGNEMETAQPMGFTIYSKRKASLRAAVTKKLLAQSPSLKVIAHLLNNNGVRI